MFRSPASSQVNPASNVRGDNVGDIVLRSLQEPSRQIAVKAGEEGSVIVRDVMNEKGNVGYNASNGKMEDLLDAGVIDPAKVTKTALMNASSISGLTTEALVSEVKDDKADAAPAMPDMGGMGGMM